MSLNESTLEDAALEWLGEKPRYVNHARLLVRHHRASVRSLEDSPAPNEGRLAGVHLWAGCGVAPPRGRHPQPGRRFWTCTPNFGAQLPDFGRQLPDFGRQLPDLDRQLPEFGAQLPEFGRTARPGRLPDLGAAGVACGG
jgi:hypothetical protein